MRSTLAYSAQPPSSSDAFRVHNKTAPVLTGSLANRLVAGGDARLAVSEEDGLNVYGCLSVPRPDAIALASTTASTISARGFARAESACQNLVAQSGRNTPGEAFETRLEALRDELKTHLQLPGDAAEIVFSPSGTDTQLHALFAAHAILGGPLASIVVGADETGSGTTFTACGRHFGECTARGTRVGKGDDIAGLCPDTISIRIAIKDDHGVARAPGIIDDEVEAAVAHAIAQGRRVVLHAMDRSKLGWRAPSQACLSAIRTNWPGAVQIVVDACQARLAPARIAAHLARGYLVLLTGSKFFTGPPFSGAMLVPKNLGTALATARVPVGLTDYSNRAEWPMCWPTLRAQLPAEPNYGAWLRWEAALAEIGAYFAVPSAARRAILDRFADAVCARINDIPALTLLPAQSVDYSDGTDDAEFAIRTVFPFTLRRNGDLLPADACAAIYRALNRDMSDRLACSTAGTHAQRICHIGQPVTLPGTAALRLSAGARLISECWNADDLVMQRALDQRIGEVAVTLAKTEWLLDRLPDLVPTKGSS
jgi:selenocysteine lyase/cysteine desulfurase